MISPTIAIARFYFAKSEPYYIGATKDTVVVVDNVPVAKDEFLWRMSCLRSACFDHFLKKNIENNTIRFWNDSSSGITPLQWIKEKALEQIVVDNAKIKIIQGYDVLQGFNYEQFLYVCNSENSKRQQLIEKGQVIYGLESFDKLVFYEYLMSNALLKTYTNISAKNPPSTKDLEEYYELKKKERFVIGKTIIIDLRTLDNELKKNLRNKNLILNVSKISLRRLRKRCGSIITEKELVFESIHRRTDELQWGNILTQAFLLSKQGARSEVFKDNLNNNCFVILKKTINNGYQQFDLVRDLLIASIAKDQFDRVLKRNLKNISVTKKMDVWSSIQME